jgi:hypothetical protein
LSYGYGSRKMGKSPLSLSILFGLLITVMFACGGGMIQRIDHQGGLPSPPPKQGFLTLPQGPPNTIIYFDERCIGRYRDYPKKSILLPVGLHRVKLSAKDHANIYLEVKISSDRPFVVKGKLLFIPPTL